MNTKIDRILLGDNPFIGVDHLSQERSREKVIGLGPEKIARVIDSALTNGAEGLACSAHSNLKAALGYMRKEEYPNKFGIYLIVPDAQTYVRQASENGMLGLLNETVGKLPLMNKAKAIIQGSVSALTLDPKKMMKAYLEAEVSLFSKYIPSKSKVKAVFLHELLTEIIISFNLYDIAAEFIELVRDDLGIFPGFVTRNFSKFVEFSIQNRLPFSEMVVMTPFNRVGFQMNPSRQSSEESLRLATDGKIIAMSVLAGGHLELNVAIEYLKSLPLLTSCVVGVSTEAHAKETFSHLRSSFPPSYKA